eukprot:3049117-Rhodomonas_salina.3
MDKKLSHILDSKEAVSIPQTKPCASQRHAVDAAFLSRLMSPATSDAIAYLLQTFSRAAKAGVRACHPHLRTDEHRSIMTCGSIASRMRRTVVGDG